MRLRWTYAIASVSAICIAILALSNGGEPIHACECVETNSPTERMEEATAVFLGRTTDMRFQDWPFDIDSADVPPDEPLTVEFSVRTVWKGDVSKIQYLTTGRSEPCGFEFGKHKDYLVYADGEQGALQVLGCSRTQLAAEAQEDLESLGEGYLPGHATRGVIRPATLDCYATAQSARSNLISWPLGLIAGVVWFGFRKRRQK